MTTQAPAPTVIAGDEALAAFRQGLTGAYAFDLLDQAGGRLLLQLAVGVGKSQWMLRIILHALAGALYDLILVLVPRWDILRELLNRLPPGARPVVLAPRPRQRCGALDADWVDYEQAACGALGRAQLCGACPLRQKCPWPDQYGSRLRGARLILATQQHLIINPSFLIHLQQQARAASTLTLLDESNFLVRPAERTIDAQDLGRFVEAQRVLPAGPANAAAAAQWLGLSELVSQAPTGDLRGGDWRFPWVDAAWALAVQRRGWELFGGAFRFLGHELHHFSHSDPCGRERLPTGGIRFASLPYLGRRFIIFSGSMAKELARYRLDPNHARPALASPFEGHRFSHPGTRWFNINSLAAAARFFRKNAGHVLDFFAAKVTRNIQEGKRTLLVSRKRFVPLCRRLLRERLEALGVGAVRVVTGAWGRHDLHDPRTLCLITYGMAGVNRFEHCEAAYCLTGYYVSADAVSRAVQDVEATGERYPVRVLTDGDPPRRVARVDLPDGRVPLLPGVAQAALEQQEGDVVVQAVGRVRPFTRVREIITLHASSLPGVHYNMEFRTLEQARRFFQVQTPAQAGLAGRVEQAWRLKAQGRSRTQIAEELGVSLSTVKRYLRRQGGHVSFV